MALTERRGAARRRRSALTPPIFIGVAGGITLLALCFAAIVLRNVEEDLPPGAVLAQLEPH